MQYFKLHIGQYGDCSAPTMIEPSVSYNGLSRQVAQSLKMVKYGMDLYITTPKGEVYAWYRDLSKYSKEDIREILR